MNDDFIIRSKQEASFLLNGRKFKSVFEFDMFAREVLSKYIRRKDKLDNIVSTKLFTYEIMFVEWADGTVFKDFIDFFFVNLRVALEHHREDVLELYIKSDLDIHEALVSYQDSAVMSSMTVNNKRTKVKAGFNSLGDMIECSLYPQLRLVYGVLTLSKDSSLYGKKDNPSNGKMVSELIESSEVMEATLRTILFNVSLNQWRNISNHASYKYVKSSDSVLCKYGSNNNQTVSFQYHQLRELLKAIDCIQILLKVCSELPNYELDVKKHTDNTNEGYELTKESLMSHVGNVLAILDYEVFSVDKVLNNWKINVTDLNSLGISAFRELAGELAPYFLCIYKLHGVFIELEVYDIKGQTFQKMSLDTAEILN